MPIRRSLGCRRPLDSEAQYEALVDAHIRDAFGLRGDHVSDERFEAANQVAVDSFAPNAYQAICYVLASGDGPLAAACYADVAARAQERDCAGSRG